MRSGLFGLLGLALAAVAIGDGASATPAPPAPKRLTWADWVGDWEGKLKWSGCSVDGQPAATVPIEATDGAIAIDLTTAGGALASIGLVDDNDGWVGQRDDVTVHLARTPAALELAIDLDSGCAIRGTLHRATIGIATCDQLEAWSRIEGRCTK